MTDEDKALKARREAHIEALKEMYDTMSESENWEHMKRLIDAVTAGAFAIARLNEIDYGKTESKDCERENIKQVLKDVAKRCQNTQVCHNCDLCDDKGSCLIDGHPWEWNITLEEDK